MSEVKVGDRLEDPEGNVWTVTGVFPDAPAHYPPVLLERVRTVRAWASLDEIGPSARRYRPVTEATDGE